MTTTQTRVLTADVIDRCLAKGRPAFIGYLPTGFPDLAASVAAAKALIDNGANIVELGLPYSDPSMDGSVIQHATTVALERGFKVKQLFHAVQQVAEHGRAADAAVVVMTYWNPVLRYGPDAFARDMASAGGAGLITPDLTPDAGPEWIDAADAHDLDKIFLVAPSSSTQRLKMTSDASRGFVYAASLMGVTGERGSVGAQARTLVERTRTVGARRVCVGLGVSTPDQACEVGAYADGVIVGSALVKALDSEGVSAVGATAAKLAAGVAAARRP